MLWPLYLEYNFVGGMPKAVDAGVNLNKKKMNSLISNVRKVQTDIIKGYIRDFGKFSENKKLAIQIEAVFESVLVP